jgi:hypothetical protein
MGILGAYLTYVGSRAYWRAKRNLVRGESAKRKVAEALRKSPIVQKMVEQGFSKEEIFERLNLRTARGKDFEKATGIPWPL